MAPSHLLSQTLVSDSHECDLPILNPNKNIVYFDVQSAEPGVCTIPGVIDLEVYEPGEIAEFSWIYFKGDPQAGPSPGHPFDMPFNNTFTKFSLDIVENDDNATFVRQIMRKLT